jgi:hypothetical protein
MGVDQPRQKVDIPTARADIKIETGTVEARFTGGKCFISTEIAI